MLEHDIGRLPGRFQVINLSVLISEDFWIFLILTVIAVLLGSPILSLLQLHPLDRYRAPSAIGTAIGRPYLASPDRQELSIISF